MNHKQIKSRYLELKGERDFLRDQYLRRGLRIVRLEEALDALIEQQEGVYERQLWERRKTAQRR